jgi:hypothetical protein
LPRSVVLSTVRLVVTTVVSLAEMRLDAHQAA